MARNSSIDDIRVTFRFDSSDDERHFEVFNKLMEMKNAHLVFGDFYGMEFEVDYRKEKEL